MFPWKGGETRKHDILNSGKDMENSRNTAEGLCDHIAILEHSLPVYFVKGTYKWHSVYSPTNLFQKMKICVHSKTSIWMFTSNLLLMERQRFQLFFNRSMFILIIEYLSATGNELLIHARQHIPRALCWVEKASFTVFEQYSWDGKTIGTDGKVTVVQLRDWKGRGGGHKTGP